MSEFPAGVTAPTDGPAADQIPDMPVLLPGQCSDCDSVAADEQDEESELSDENDDVAESSEEPSDVDPTTSADEESDSESPEEEVDVEDSDREGGEESYADDSDDDEPLHSVTIRLKRVHNGGQVPSDPPKCRKSLGQ